MHINGEQIFYQTSIEVYPSGSISSPMDSVIEKVRSWLAKTCGPDVSRTAREAVGKRPQAAWPPDYQGTSVDSSDTGECVRMSPWSGKSLWAVDYDKPDGKERHMRWHTSIGVDDLDGSCRVNIRIVTYMVSGWCDLFAAWRSISVPGIVRMLERMDGVECYCGGYEYRLSSKRVPVLASTWDRDFVSTLLDPERTIPVVVVTTDRDGNEPISSSTLAMELVGTAIVFALDLSQYGVNQKLLQTFPYGTNERTWAPCPSTVRVYRPNISLSEKASKCYTYEFGKETLERYSRNFNLFLRDALIKWGERTEELYGTEDLDERQMKERSQKELEDVWQLAEDARKDADEFRELAESYSQDVSELSNVTPVVVKGERNEVLEKALEDSQVRLDKVEEAKRYYQGRSNTLQNELEEQRDEADRLRNELKAFEGMSHIPTKLSELLNFVEEVYKDRITVLEGAHESAEKFDGKYALDDEWAILRGISKELWDIYFNSDGGSRIDSEFLSRTGFELALNESDATLSNQRAQQARTVRYKGETFITKMHVKGRNNSQGKAFRVYYILDSEERKIVITHCGDHLYSAITKRRNM